MSQQNEIIRTVVSTANQERSTATVKGYQFQFLVTKTDGLVSGVTADGHSQSNEAGMMETISVNINEQGFVNLNYTAGVRDLTLVFDIVNEVQKIFTEGQTIPESE